MGQITLTNFGLTKTVTLTNAQVIGLATPVTIVPAITGKILVPVFTVARLTWVADYGNIDANAAILINVGTVAFGSLAENVNSYVSHLLAQGENSAAYIPFIAALGVAAIYGTSGFLDSDVLSKPITVSLSNGAAGALTDGNVGNSLKVTTFYNVITP